MPVARGGTKSSRQAMLLVVAGLLGVVAMIFVITRVTSQASRGEITINVGDQRFRPGPAEVIAELVDDGGPLLFSDVASGDRDVIIQHIGDDEQSGWFAFAARSADSARDCAVEWQEASETFEDSCDGASYSAEGDGLTQYPVEVEVDGILVVDLNADSRKDG
jgi:hypothetical protein